MKTSLLLFVTLFSAALSMQAEEVVNLCLLKVDTSMGQVYPYADVKAERHYEETKMQREGNAFGRQCILAAEKFNAAAARHFNDEWLKLYSRKLWTKKEREDFVREMGGQGTIYFVTLSIDSPVVQTTGNGSVMVAVGVSYSVMSPKGKVFTSGRAKKSMASRNRVAQSTDVLVLAAMEASFDEVARRINDHFVVRANNPPPGNHG